MSLTITIPQAGDAFALRAIDQTVPEPAAGEVRLRQRVIGVNFVDIYFRSGVYPLPQPDAVPGFEAAGVIERIGAGVSGWRVGERVAYMGAPMGAYAEVRNVAASQLVRLPDNVSDVVAGSSMLRGLTVHMLLRQVYAVQPDDWVLVHAAAGGVGQLLTRWATRLGARVIGTVSSTAKAEIAAAAGAHSVLLHSQSDWPAQVRDLTDGLGVHLAVDGIGGAVLQQTFAAMRPFGVLANIGQAGGAVPPVDIAKMGPILLGKPSVLKYVNNPAWYAAGTAELLTELASGLLNPVGSQFKLADAASAHQQLEAGKTTGSVILTV